MLNLPQDPQRSLRVLHALYALNQPKFKPLIEWLEETFVNVAHQVITMDGDPKHFRYQGVQITLDKFLEYHKQASVLIDSLEKELRQPRPE